MYSETSKSHALAAARRIWRAGRRPVAAAFALATAAFATGCPGSLENPEDFETNEQPVVDPCNGLITKKCALANCHDAKSSSVDLTLEGREDRTVDKPGVSCTGKYIDTTNPDASLMYTKCASPTQTCGAAMPLGTQGLEAEDLSCLLGYVRSFGSGTTASGSTSSSGASSASSTSGSTGSAGGGG